VFIAHLSLGHVSVFQKVLDPFLVFRYVLDTSKALSNALRGVNHRLLEKAFLRIEEGQEVLLVTIKQQQHQ